MPLKPIELMPPQLLDFPDSTAALMIFLRLRDPAVGELGVMGDGRFVLNGALATDTAAIEALKAIAQGWATTNINRLKTDGLNAHVTPTIEVDNGS